jgi:hypothetical protein
MTKISCRIKKISCEDILFKISWQFMLLLALPDHDMTFASTGENNYFHSMQ